MFKNVIAPMQAWLMSQGRCVADGKELSKMKKSKKKDGTYKVTCACGRIYVYDARKKRNQFRRALLEEV